MQKIRNIKASIHHTAFKISFEVHFAINIPSVARLLARRRQNFLCKKSKACFAFCDVILSVSNISFDNSISMDDEIKCGYNEDLMGENIMWMN